MEQVALLYYLYTLDSNIFKYYNRIMEEEITEETSNGDSHCPRCGLRSYDDICQNCGSPIVDKKDDEEEEWDWRETKR